METFTVNGVQFPYLQQRWETDSIGERTIEVPIARAWLQHVGFERTLEVGAVMPYHWGITERNGSVYPCPRVPVSWEVIDWSDPAGTHADAVTYPYYADRDVLSLSTIEHVGHDQCPNGQAPTDACDLFERIITESRRYLISWPIGWNPLLDGHAAKTTHPRFLMRQISAQNRWAQILDEDPSDWKASYGAPYFAGNVVAFFTNVPIGA